MRAATLAVSAIAAALPAHAVTCAEEIAALFDGGTLDPFARPAHRQTRESFAADGTLIATYEAVIESPLEMVSGVKGQGRYLLLVDREGFMGPSMDGPWTAAGMTVTEDMEAAQRAVAPSQAANLTETECLGEVDVDGRPAIAYRFVTRVDPHPARGDSWWGSRDTVHLDPETRQVFRWEQTEQVSSWAEGTSDEVHVTHIEYDETIDLVRPE